MDAAQHLNTIHYNPVKHGLQAQPDIQNGQVEISSLVRCQRTTVWFREVELLDPL